MSCTDDLDDGNDKLASDAIVLQLTFSLGVTVDLRKELKYWVDGDGAARRTRKRDLEVKLIRTCRTELGENVKTSNRKNRFHVPATVDVDCTGVNPRKPQAVPVQKPSQKTTSLFLFTASI